MKHLPLSLLLFAISGSSGLHAKELGTFPLAGADESTPSLSHYFSWIDNTNEGSTEKQTLANLEFFKWLHDDYGMELDIYALDAGAIDTPGGYGSMDSERFKKQFPNGFGPIAEKKRNPSVAGSASGSVPTVSAIRQIRKKPARKCSSNCAAISIFTSSRSMPSAASYVKKSRPLS